ncbi:MAG: hypothetical protein J6M62_10315 [Selenomonadaceae bacterium]|nr:hypothetical protein [Selenomonadaceae bacterium]
MRDKFLFFKNFKTVADKLPDELRLKFYDAITNYVFEGIEPNDAVIAALVGAIKPSLDKEERRGGNHNPTGQNQHSEVKTGQTRLNKQNSEVKTLQTGQLFQEEETGNNKQEVKENNTLASVTKENTLQEVKDDSGMMDIEELIAQTPPKPKEKPFTPPTLQEVKDYVSDKKLTIDAEGFYNYFTEGKWKDSEGKPVRNWKQKALTWDAHERKKRTVAAAKSLLGVKSGTYGKDIPL